MKNPCKGCLYRRSCEANCEVKLAYDLMKILADLDNGLGLTKEERQTIGLE